MTRFVLVLFAVGLAVASLAAQAGGEEEAPGLARRVAVLEQVLLELRADVTALEGRVATLEAAVGGEAPGSASSEEPLSPSERVRVRKAQVEMRMLANAVQMYYLTTRRVPADLEALTRPQGRLGAPFLQSVPADPWGAAYTLEILGGRTFRIRSAGPDGRAMTDDDLTWPED